MPAPHSPAPVPGFAQVSVPPALTVQPLARSRLSAEATLYGYGFERSYWVVNGLGGASGTGP